MPVAPRQPCVGKYFFIKIISEEPEGAVVFLKEYPVPDCILRRKIPPEGWNEIPGCDK
ncbi:hypothetical protein HNQ91_004698 [Filimonas zeae]|nr:hypothetical protein [Filimonas zeae]